MISRIILLLSLSVSDSELSIELLESLSELKLVLEVAELSLDSDSEVYRSEFCILMAKSVIFWTQVLTVPCTTNTVNERPHRLQHLFQWEFYFEKVRGSQTLCLHM